MVNQSDAVQVYIGLALRQLTDVVSKGELQGVQCDALRSLNIGRANTPAEYQIRQNLRDNFSTRINGLGHNGGAIRGISDDLPQLGIKAF